MADIRSMLQNRNVTIDGRRTSLRLEQDVWDAFEEICERENLSIHELCTLIDRNRHNSSRTAAVRAFILSYFRNAATDSGHVKAGHGALAERLGGGDALRASA